LCNVLIPIPHKNLPNACEDFVVSQGGADDAGQEGPLGSADAGLRQKTARIRQVFMWNGFDWGEANMRVFLEETVVKQALADVSCNVCGRAISKEASGYFEDHISIAKPWGYHSPYDGEIHAIDVCVGCYQDWVGDFEIPPKTSCYCLMSGDGQCVGS